MKGTRNRIWGNSEGKRRYWDRAKILIMMCCCFFRINEAKHAKKREKITAMRLSRKLSADSFSFFFSSFLTVANAGRNGFEKDEIKKRQGRNKWQRQCVKCTTILLLLLQVSWQAKEKLDSTLTLFEATKTKRKTERNERSWRLKAKSACSTAFLCVYDKLENALALTHAQSRLSLLGQRSLSCFALSKKYLLANTDGKERMENATACLLFGEL